MPNSNDDCGCIGAGKGSANPPGLAAISYRVGNFASFRRALLRPLANEVSLKDWQPIAGSDLGLQMLEWWAYLSDILTFYNERAANEMFLDTARRPESVNRLIRLLGYRPRPGLAATGTLVALAGGNRPLVLPRGFEFDSKPGPGETPQTFELDVDTTISPFGAVAATPKPYLFDQTQNAFLVAGTAVPFTAEASLLLRKSDGSDPTLLTVDSLTAEIGPDGQRRTRVKIAHDMKLPADAIPGHYTIEYASQSSILFGHDAAIAGQVVHLAGVARELQPGQPIAFRLGSKTSVLRNILSVRDVVWYANPPSDIPGNPPDPPAIPLAILHSEIVLTEALSTWAAAETALLFGWRSVGQILEQPAVFKGIPGRIDVSSELPLSEPETTVIVSDSRGNAVRARAVPKAGGLALHDLPEPPITLSGPLEIQTNLLAVSRGKTVLNEVLGSGDASIPGQQFVLKKAPLTYLARGAGVASTLSVRVNGSLWCETANFLDQPADARIFVTSQNEAQTTHVHFGDGVNGARLPTGTDNVIASYRHGSGAHAPASGTLTVINKPYPNLKSIKNPIAVAGGADPDAPDQIRRFAPGSVLTFGRAISGDDYLVIVSSAPGVKRAQAVWSYDAVHQRAAVKIYVGDDPAAVESARAAIADVGDPHRHVIIVAATPVRVALAITLVVDSSLLPPDEIVAGVKFALLDEETGTFGSHRLGVGKAAFDSEISAACLAVFGAVAIHNLRFSTIIGQGDNKMVPERGERHSPGDGAFFTLAADSLTIEVRES